MATASRSSTLAAAALLGGLLAGCGGDSEDGSSGGGPTIADAVDACPPRDNLARVQVDGPNTVTVVGVPTSDMMELLENQAVAIGTAECLVSELGGPASIGSRMSTALGAGSAPPDSESWDGFEANWSVDGNSGIFFSIDARD